MARRLHEDRGRAEASAKSARLKASRDGAVRTRRGRSAGRVYVLAVVKPVGVLVRWTVGPMTLEGPSFLLLSCSDRL